MFAAASCRAKTFPKAAYWIVPALACLLLHARSLSAWFRADDFAWLSSSLDIHNFHDLARALFTPAAQGTIRPLSESGFFLAGYWLFGLHALPFRLIVFATQFVNFALVSANAVRLTGMPAAGFWAVLLWAINASLAEPLGWTCTYNQVMCGAFLLLAFYFLTRHIETGERRFFIYQWIAFVAGFGALETNLVYPVLASSYTLLFAPKHFRRTVPLAAVSVLYVALHVAAAPPPSSGVYAMHFSGGVLGSLPAYWIWSVGTPFLDFPLRLPSWMLPAGVAVVTAGLTAFVFAKWRARWRVALLCLLWFIALIAPVLPFRDHLTEYYIYLPVIGLCWLGGWAVASAWQSGQSTRAAAGALALIYCLMAIPETFAAVKANYWLATRARNLVEGVARAHQLHPDKAILLEGVDTDLFENAVLHQPFRLVGADHVYLAAGSARTIAGDASSFELPAEAERVALARGELIVYDVHGPRLRNITALYSAIPGGAKIPAVVDAANPLTGYLLGPEWYAIDEDHRWMPRRATLRIAGPERPGLKLYVRGGTVRQLLERGPVTLTVSADGITLPAVQISEEHFDVSFPLPPALTGKPEITLVLEASRAFHNPPDPRELALHFGVFAVR